MGGAGDILLTKEIRKSTALRAAAAAAASEKPLFDMLALWNDYANIRDPESDDDYAAKTDKLIKDWARTKGLPLSLYLPGRSPLTPAEAPAQASGIIDRGLSLITVLNSIGIIAEAASLGQLESVIWAMTNIINASGVPSITQDLYRTPVEIGVKIPLQRRMLSDYQPMIPDQRALVNLRARTMLSKDTYTSLMYEHGYPDWASEMMAYADTRMPGFDKTLSLFQRGVISWEIFQSWLRRDGLNPDAVLPLAALRWQLPGYADIISIYMKEGYLEEKWVEIPDEFLTYLGQLGYDSNWAKRLWGKHWVLPGVDHLYEMFHKGIIDYDTMVKMLKYHDFEPVWRERLIANAYNMIPRVDVRRGYRYGMISTGELKQRYSWLGFKPSDAEIMAGIAQRESLARYYTRLETVARSAFRKGKLTDEGFKSILKEINTPDAAVALTLKAETLARDAAVLEPAEEPRTLTVSQILTAYNRRLIDNETALNRLIALGFEEDDIALLLEMSWPRPEPAEVNRDLVTAASAFYKEGLMDPSLFRGYLRKAGLSEPDIEAKVDAEDLRYRLDFFMDLITMAKEAFRKDVYTWDELYNQLIYYGMQPQRAWAIVSLESLRKLPKPRAG